MSETGQGGQKAQISVMKYIRYGDVACSTALLVNNTVLHAGELLREEILTVLITRKNFCNYVW